MKLKKIVSLALAGILAVSMLAGCGNNSDSNNNNVVPTPSTSIVDAVNNGQDASNKVKVTFTSDADLQDALKAAIAMKGTDVVKASDIESLIPEDFVAETAIWGATDYPGKVGSGSSKLDIDGESQSILKLYPITGVNTEKAALNKAATAINSDIKQLVAKSYDEDNHSTIHSGKKYYVFDYEGSVAMVSVELSNGTTKYFVAGILTQTATEKKAA